MCASYKETMFYRASHLFHLEPLIAPPSGGCVIQYVCDNADHNVATLGGLNTFNSITSMGIIWIVATHDNIYDKWC